MTEYRKISRLNSLGLSGRSIAGNISPSRNTVSDVLARASRQGMAWPLPLELRDLELERRLLLKNPENLDRTKKEDRRLDKALTTNKPLPNAA